MKILFLSPTYFPIRGGTEQAVHELAARLKNSHDVVIVTIRWEKGWRRSETIDGVAVHRVGYLRARGLSGASKCLALFLKTAGLSLRTKFDVVHMFHVLETGCAAFLLRKVLRKPLLITAIGWDTYDPHIRLAKKHLFVIRTAMKAADLVTAPSRFHAAAAKAQGYKRDITVVPLGGSLQGRAGGRHLELRGKLGLEGKKIVLSVQRLHPRKGLEDLLAAIPAIVAAKPEAHFLLVGEGPEEKNLREQARALGINSHLTLAGFVPDGDLPSYYAAADLFVLPTLYESFGLVYVDALSFGLPIVTTENSGALDIIDERNGILVPVKDPEKLGRAVIEALERAWDRTAIQAGADRFDWTAIAARYEELYASVISS